MADAPKITAIDIATSAAAQIVSRIVPERIYSYLAALLPGVFFEISIVVADPTLISRLVERAEQSFTLGRPITVTIALFLAYLIGTALMFIPPLIQHYVLEPLYRIWWFLWKQFCKWPLFPIVRWLMGKKRFAPMTEVHDFYKYILDIGFTIRPEEAQNAWSCWLTFARRLLKQRYGINPDDLHQDNQWGALYWILGIWYPEDLRGNLLVICLEATGWAGLAASRVAPALQTKYFLYFVGLLIVIGLLHDLYVVRRNVDPRISSYSHIRAILRELRRLPEPKADTKPAAVPEGLADLEG